MAYNEEHSRWEEQMAAVKKNMDSRQKLMRNKLLTVLGATETMELEDAVSMACDIIEHAKI